ncbi:MAG: DegT/DnrJ/EryC1/StrS family aminotransferase [Candidatus Scalindua sp. AMX11]|nr:MAG: DegT/DnrJ/EryC1/StrS family aminotransferase [Candidatus Scalindua sp.]NOG83480.1 DegT/DnrJ/EryC1/StrS family aminotransferase [Planctomycetota bacterium]RZV72904.1 MAG: DegT/DnrJ/EryC1/StrS family aminotransferase [Candidatus Scalindua sp. SCAELEC01]TDE64799.1 MAG: DegT/DnrJ/EryC1/StrS family aminotransferase [Candidatus Scalindua sp. AMX11]GJQ59820.1 MAG: glutamine--scyllo-inositol aminotransferase [Candidatus Scalindua sp.]
MKVPFVDLVSQYQGIRNQILPVIENIMGNAQFIMGEDVTLFEQEFAEFCTTKFAIGVDSGTSALELALRAFDIGTGDEVITVANTFIATALAISSTGATPVLVDINPETYNIDVEKIEGAISEQTRVIMPVHLYGQPADMDAILAIAKEHNLLVIEDACQAHGAKYRNLSVGSIGHAAAFSFYPGKNLGAFGDGGMVVTNDPQIADKLKLLRDYGQKEKYHHLIKGYNRRLDTLQAGVLRTKLRYLNEWNESRRRHASRYNELLQDSKATLPVNADFAEYVYHLFVIRIQHRNEILTYLQQNGISVGIHYPIPIHLQPAYADLGYQEGDFPVTEQYANEILSLPMFPELNDDQINYVTSILKEFK